MGLQTISETNSVRFYVISAFLVFVTANFFPSIQSLDRWFGADGRCVYTHVFHSPHHNPLGWQNYGYGDLKKQVISQWSEAYFPQKPLFLVENFGPYTSAQFVFFRNVLYSFPPIELLEANERYKKMYHEYQLRGEELFAELVNEQSVPLFLYAIKPLPEERDSRPLRLSELLRDEHFSIDHVNDDLFVFAFNQALIDWAESTGVLAEKYNCLELPLHNPIAVSCVDKRFSEQTEGMDFGKEILKQIMDGSGKLMKPGNL